MKANVYILHAKSVDRFYIGSCLDVELRIKQHNENLLGKAFTNIADDWRLFWKLEELEHTQAREIESHIKKMKSRVYIQNLAQFPEMADTLL